MKRLGEFLAAFAIALTIAALPALPVQAATSTAGFTVSATVNSVATLSFGLNNGTYTWSGITNNIHAQQAADNNSSGTVTAALRSTASSGSSSIFITAPSGPLQGTGSNTVPLSLLSFNCTGSYSLNTSGGTTTGNTTGIATTIHTVTAGSSNTCASFGAGVSIPTTAITLNMYLDDRYLPADTYNLSGFVITVSAT